MTESLQHRGRPALSFSTVWPRLRLAVQLSCSSEAAYQPDFAGVCRQPAASRTAVACLAMGELVPPFSLCGHTAASFCCQQPPTWLCNLPCRRPADCAVFTQLDCLLFNVQAPHSRPQTALQPPASLWRATCSERPASGETLSFQTGMHTPWTALGPSGGPEREAYGHGLPRWTHQAALQ